MQPAEYRSVNHVLQEVREMRVKGGSAFGVAAASAFRYVVEDDEISTSVELFIELERVASSLIADKPTMGTIHNAYEIVVKDARTIVGESDIESARREVAARADRFIEHSMNAVHELGIVGAELVHTGQTIMMHSYSASVLSVFETAWRLGKRFQVICTESRPLRESRLAANRMTALGIPVTYVTDASMAEMAVSADWILVGADSIASDGAVANKMGTNLLSIVAERFAIPFFVASELLKFRPHTGDGSAIVLERRPISEVAGPGDFDRKDLVTVVNQFFDLTSPQRIRGIVTERGVHAPARMGQIWQTYLATFEGMGNEQRPSSSRRI